MNDSMNWGAALGIPNKTRNVMVVTSWSPAGAALYGDDWSASAARFWPPSMRPVVITDAELEKDPEFVAFMARHAHRRMNPHDHDYDFRMDLVRFAHKVFALKVAIDSVDTDWLIWLDGDVTTRDRITEEFLDSILLEDHDGVLLSRSGTASAPECGFMAFNLRRGGIEFLQGFIKLYTSDAVLQMAEHHDSHVFMAAVLAHMEAKGSKWLDLAPRGGGKHGLDAFEVSPLHSFFTHRKGNRKFTELPPCSNERILGMLAAGRGVTRIQAKPCLWPRTAPEAGSVVIIECGMHGIDNIRQTVLKYANTLQIYDGYYTADAHGSHIDDTLHGVNSVVNDLIVFDSIETAVKGFIHIAVPAGFPNIPVSIPIFTHRMLAPINKSDVTKLSKDAYKTNFLLQTQNCVSNEEIHANITANMLLMSKWITNTYPHRNRAIVVSGGPSIHFPETMAEIRREIAAGAYVLCVKHAHQHLIASGIIPWGCVLLDPREHEGTSTHGHSRRDLIPKAHPGVRYFVASMVHPSVTKKLLDSGGKIIGWHAAVGADEKKILPPEHAAMLMGGGTSSAGRTVLLAWQFLGFGSIGLYGFDSCHLDHSSVDRNARHQDGTPKYVMMDMAVQGAHKEFLTDRDILSQAQDFTRFMKEAPWIPWDSHGEGMVAFLWENTKGKLPKIDSY